MKNLNAADFTHACKRVGFGNMKRAPIVFGTAVAALTALVTISANALSDRSDETKTQLRKSKYL